MAVTPIAHISASSPDGTTFTSGDIDTSTADLIVVAVGNYQANNPTLTENKSNGVPIALTTSHLVGDTSITCYYWPHPLVGSAHNFTLASAGQAFGAICIAAFKGVKLLSPFDVENGAVNASSSTIQPGSITPSFANDLIIAVLGWEPSRTVAIDSGFTILDQVNYGAGQHYGCALAYKIKTDALPENPTWTITGGNAALATRIAAFKSADEILRGQIISSALDIQRSQDRSMSITRSQTDTLTIKRST